MAGNPIFDTLATIDEGFYRQVAAQPRATALLFEGRTWSFGELATNVERVAAFLISQGVGRGDRVAWWGKNHADYIILLLACACTGAVLVVVNWRLAEREVQSVLQDCAPALLVVTEEYAQGAPAGSWVAGGVPLGPCRPLEQAVAGPLERRPGADPKQPFVQLYTSGTTGVPKGVPQSHLNHLACYRAWSASGFGIWGHDDRCLVSLPVFHAIGTNFSLYALLQGAGVHLLREFSLEGAREALAGGKITRMPLVPAMIDMLTRDEQVSALDHDRLRTIIYGGSSIPLPVLERGMQVFGCEFAQGYAATETTSAGAILAPEDHQGASSALRSCGRAMAGIDLEIVGPDAEPLRDGEVGEILLRGDAVMAGYWNRPDETNKVLRDGWYWTGDAGFRDPSGLVTIVDRTRDLMISGGENVYPSEVELPLRDHPKILDVGVFGVPDDRWGDRIAAAIVVHPGQDAPSLEDLRLFLNSRIARYKHPRQLLVLDALPRNPTGKLQRSDLVRLATAADQAAASHALPDAVAREAVPEL